MVVSRSVNTAGPRRADKMVGDSEAVLSCMVLARAWIFYGLLGMACGMVVVAFLCDAEASPPPMVIADVRSGTAGDPGYKATALMAVESALCLALERGECDAAGGVLTPATGLGQVLARRLNDAGMQLATRLIDEDRR